MFQLVAEDTVEDRVLEIQKNKDKLISQAFSGNKGVVKEKEKIGESGRLAFTGRRILTSIGRAESRLKDVQAIFGL